jgi:sec-independent protein translocase protein TatB
MFNINSWELIIIIAIALIVVGPERLPELMFRAGRMIRQIREATDAATAELTRELRQVAEMTEAQLTEPPATARPPTGVTEPAAPPATEALSGAEEPHIAPPEAAPFPPLTDGPTAPEVPVRPETAGEASDAD